MSSESRASSWGSLRYPSPALPLTRALKVVGPSPGEAQHPPPHTLDLASQSQSNAVSCSQLYPPHHPIPTPRPDLSDAATSRAGEYNGASPIVIGGHSSQTILLVHKQGCALDGNCAAQRLVEVLPAEVVIDLQGLWEGKGETLGCSAYLEHLLPEEGILRDKHMATQRGCGPGHHLGRSGGSGTPRPIR